MSLKKHKLTLYLREWGILFVFLGIILCLCLSSLASRSRPLPQSDDFVQVKPLQTITVFVEGAVKYPGSYELEKGSSLESLLSKAVTLLEADLSKCHLEKKLRAHQRILIPENGKVMIYLEGAIGNPGLKKLPAKTRICELKSLIEPLENADLSLLNSRRQLKHAEHIKIPFKESHAS